jgi:molecular chaperone GrpE
MSKEHSVEQPKDENVATAGEGGRGKPDDAASGDAAHDDARADSQEAGQDGVAEEIEQLREQLAAAEARAKDNWERVLRAEAEKENARKRAARDAESARKRAVENFASELLAVRDSLELGLEAARQDDADLDKLIEGTELTERMLAQLMEKYSIEQIDPLGEKFNPELHQAMSMQDVEGQESNTVVSVMQKGYRLHDRLLRPALVMVAK